MQQFIEYQSQFSHIDYIVVYSFWLFVIAYLGYKVSRKHTADSFFPVFFLGLKYTILIILLAMPLFFRERVYFIINKVVENLPSSISDSIHLTIALLAFMVIIIPTILLCLWGLKQSRRI